MKPACVTIGRGALVPYDAIDSKQLKDIKEQLTYHKLNFVTQENDIVIRFYQETEHGIRVPKFFTCPSLAAVPVINKTILVPGTTPGLRYNGTLFETAARPQQTVFRWAISQIQQQKQPGCCVIMPCGTGKTNVAIAVAMSMMRTVAQIPSSRTRRSPYPSLLRRRRI